MSTFIERGRRAIDPTMSSPENLTILVKSTPREFRRKIAKARVRVPDAFRRALVAHYRGEMNATDPGSGDYFAECESIYGNLTWAGMKVQVDRGLRGEITFDEFQASSSSTHPELIA